MCGLVLGTNDTDVWRALEGLTHRGFDDRRMVRHRGWVLGLNRLAIVNMLHPDARQPLETGASVIAFNGEIFNVGILYMSMVADTNRHRPGGGTEIQVIEAIMRRTPAHFHRFLDGYYGIIRICKGTGRAIVARDMLGVIPLYYQRSPFMVASERKVLTRPIEVRPGETLTFSPTGRLLKRTTYDPVSLHLEPLDMAHLETLFVRAVARRIVHTEGPVTVALSGGLDSSLVLMAAHRAQLPVVAITVGHDPNSLEVENAKRLCYELQIGHKVIPLTEDEVNRDRDLILYHLEDPRRNPIKDAAMIRNFYTAKHAPGAVILCGEGADEIGGGYPPHLIRKGLELEWKCFSTLRSMHAINLDRVNKGGMAHTKEFRTPFLDRALVLYCMGCRKMNDKGHFRALATTWGMPRSILDKPKYSSEEDWFWKLVAGWAA